MQHPLKLEILCWSYHLVIAPWQHGLSRGAMVKNLPASTGVGDRQGSLACFSPWRHKELDMIEWLDWTELNAGDVGVSPGLGRSPGRGNGNPLQYTCLENPMDRGTWRATVHGVTKCQTLLKRLSTHTHHGSMARTRFGAESHAPDSCSGLNSDPTHYPWIPDPHHKVVQTRRLWGAQHTFIPIARKRNQVLWATTTTWGQIITYIISPWLSVLALISL